MVHLVKEGRFWEVKMDLDRLQMQVLRDIMSNVAKLQSSFRDGKFEYTNYFPNLRRGVNRLYDVTPDWYEGRSQLSGFASIRFLAGTEGQILNAVEWLCQELQLGLS